jgi:hypothetical protein
MNGDGAEPDLEGNHEFLEIKRSSSSAVSPSVQ